MSSQERQQIAQQILKKLDLITFTKIAEFDKLCGEEMVWLQELLPETLKAHSSNTMQGLPCTPSLRKLKKERERVHSLPSSAVGTPYSLFKGDSHGPSTTPYFFNATPSSVVSRFRGQTTQESNDNVTPLRRSERILEKHQEGGNPQLFKTPSIPVARRRSLRNNVNTIATTVPAEENGMESDDSRGSRSSSVSSNGSRDSVDSVGQPRKRRAPEANAGSRKSARIQQKHEQSNQIEKKDSLPIAPRKTEAELQKQIMDWQQKSGETTAQLRAQMNCVLDEEINLRKVQKKEQLENEAAEKEVQKKQQEEKEKKEKDAKEQLRREEERKEQEKRDREWKEAKEKQEQLRKEKEKEMERKKEMEKRKEEERKEAERKEKETREEERKEQERKEKERRDLERKQQEQKEREEQLRREKERLEKEQHDKLEKERLEKEHQAQIILQKQKQLKPKTADEIFDELLESFPVANSTPILNSPSTDGKTFYNELKEKIEAKNKLNPGWKQEEEDKKKAQADTRSPQFLSAKLVDVRKNRPVPVRRPPTRKESKKNLTNPAEPKSETPITLENLTNLPSQKRIVEELFKEATPQKPAKRLSTSSSHDSITSAVSSPTNSVISTASELDLPKRSSPLLTDVRKNRVAPNANRRKKSMSDIEKRTKRAEDNRLKLLQQAQQKEKEKREKKEQQTKRAQDLTSERRTKELEELRKKNEEKKRKKEDIEQQLNEKVKKIKDRIEEKDEKIENTKKLIKERKEEEKKEGEKRMRTGAEIAEEERKLKHQKTVEKAPEVEKKKQEPIKVEPMKPAKTELPKPIIVEKVVEEKKKEEVPKSAVGQLMSYLTSVMASPLKENTVPKKNEVAAVTAVTAKPKEVEKPAVQITKTEAPASNGFVSPPRISPWLQQALAQSAANNQIPSLANVLKDAKAEALTEKQLMPPPIASPIKSTNVNKNTPPSKETQATNSKTATPKTNTPNKQASSVHTEKIFDKLRQFIVAIQKHTSFTTGCNALVKEHLEKLKTVMTVEEFYFFQARMYKLGWRWGGETDSFISPPNKDTLIKSLLDMIEHTASNQQPSPESENYEISDYVSSSDSDDSESEEDAVAKNIPSWAKDQQLISTLTQQQQSDPDKIFPEVYSCNLEEIFDTMENAKKNKYKRRLEKRTSSGNWTHDGLTLSEKSVYLKDMGYR